MALHITLNKGNCVCNTVFSADAFAQRSGTLLHVCVLCGLLDGLCELCRG